MKTCNSLARQRESEDTERNRLLFYCSTKQSIFLQSFQLGINRAEVQIFAQAAKVAVNNIHNLHDNKGT
jgi:hypothetical protein